LDVIFDRALNEVVAMAHYPSPISMLD